MSSNRSAAAMSRKMSDTGKSTSRRRRSRGNTKSLVHKIQRRELRMPTASHSGTRRTTNLSTTSNISAWLAERKDVEQPLAVRMTLQLNERLRRDGWCVNAQDDDLLTDVKDTLHQVFHVVCDLGQMDHEDEYDDGDEDAPPPQPPEPAPFDPRGPVFTFVHLGGAHSIVEFLINSSPVEWGGANTSVNVERILAISGRDALEFSPSRELHFLQLWNEAQSILREICLNSLSLTKELGRRDDLINLLFQSMRSQCTFSHAMSLCEELLNARETDFHLSNVPCLREIVRDLSTSQLALFTRLLSVLVYDSEERRRDMAKPLQAAEFLLFKRDKDLISTVDRNHEVILSIPELVPRLVHLIRKVLVVPKESFDGGESEGGTREMQSVGGFEWLMLIDTELRCVSDIHDIVALEGKDNAKDSVMYTTNSSSPSSLSLCNGRRKPSLVSAAASTSSSSTRSSAAVASARKPAGGATTTISATSYVPIQKPGLKPSDDLGAVLVAVNTECQKKRMERRQNRLGRRGVSRRRSQSDGGMANMMLSMLTRMFGSNASAAAAAVSAARAAAGGGDARGGGETHSQLEQMLASVLSSGASREDVQNLHGNMLMLQQQQLQQQQQNVNGTTTLDASNTANTWLSSVINEVMSAGRRGIPEEFFNPNPGPNPNPSDPDARPNGTTDNSADSDNYFSDDVFPAHAGLQPPDGHPHQQHAHHNDNNNNNNSGRLGFHSNAESDEEEEELHEMAAERTTNQITAHLLTSTLNGRSRIDSVHMWTLVSHQIEVLFVLCSLLGEKSKVQMQDEMVRWGIIDVLIELFDKLNWEALQKPGPHEPERIHGPNCECMPESALKMQFMRLIHNLCDRENNDLGIKRLLVSHQEVIDAALKPVEIPRSNLVAGHLAQNGPHGLMHKITQVLLQLPKDSPYPFWIATCIESFLRGGMEEERAMVCRWGVLEFLVSAVLSKEFKNPAALQTNFDLMGECLRFNRDGFKQLTHELLTPEQVHELMDIACAHLVESNVFIRSVILSMNHFHEQDMERTLTATSNTTASNASDTNTEAAHESNIGDGKSDGNVSENDEKSCLNNEKSCLNNEKSCTISDSDVMCAPKKADDDNGMYPFDRCPVSEWLMHKRIAVLRGLLETVNVDGVSQENICCLNTALVFFMYARRRGLLVAYLDAIVDYPDNTSFVAAVAASSATDVDGKVGSGSLDDVQRVAKSEVGVVDIFVAVPDPSAALMSRSKTLSSESRIKFSSPCTHGKGKTPSFTSPLAEEDQDGDVLALATQVSSLSCSSPSNKSTFPMMADRVAPLRNFRQLLWLWRTYYFARAKDRRSLGISSAISEQEWLRVVNELYTGTRPDNGKLLLPDADLPNVDCW